MTTRIVIVQCTAEKAETDRKLPAKDLYMESRLFEAQRRYAEAYGDHWFILSAKHGLLSPEEEIRPYDEKLETGHNYSEHVQEELDEFFATAASDGLVSFDDSATIKPPGVGVHFELICGGEYAGRLRTYLEIYDLDYSEPFEGQRLAVRTKNMIEAAREVENDQLAEYA